MFHYVKTSSDRDEWVEFMSPRICPLYSKVPRSTKSGSKRNKPLFDEKDASVRTAKQNVKDLSETKEKKPSRSSLKPKPVAEVLDPSLESSFVVGGKQSMVSSTTVISQKFTARFDVKREAKGRFYSAIVKSVQFDESDKKILFHYSKSNDKYDEWIEFGSPRICAFKSKVPMEMEKKKAMKESRKLAKLTKTQEALSAFSHMPMRQVTDDSHESESRASYLESVATGPMMPSSIPTVTDTLSSTIPKYSAAVTSGNSIPNGVTSNTPILTENAHPESGHMVPSSKTPATALDARSMPGEIASNGNTVRKYPSLTPTTAFAAPQGSANGHHVVAQNPQSLPVKSTDSGSHGVSGAEVATSQQSVAVSSSNPHTMGLQHAGLGCRPSPTSGYVAGPSTLPAISAGMSGLDILAAFAGHLQQASAGVPLQTSVAPSMYASAVQAGSQSSQSMLVQQLLFSELNRDDSNARNQSGQR